MYWDFLAHHIRVFATQHPHFHQCFKRPEIQLHMPPFPVQGTDLCCGIACFINKRCYHNPLFRFDAPGRQFLWRILLVKCPVQPVGICWPFQNKQTVFFAKPLATLTEIDMQGAMLLENHISPCQLQKNEKEIVFKVSIAKNDITFGMRESNCLRRVCSPVPFPS